MEDAVSQNVGRGVGGEGGGREWWGGWGHQLIYKYVYPSYVGLLIFSKYWEFPNYMTRGG